MFLTPGLMPTAVAIDENIVLESKREILHANEKPGSKVCPAVLQILLISKELI